MRGMNINSDREVIVKIKLAKIEWNTYVENHITVLCEKQQNMNNVSTAPLFPKFKICEKSYF